MKKYVVMIIFNLAGLVFSGCGASIDGGVYSIELPALPSAWKNLSGTPQWRVEWINPKGNRETATVREHAKPEIALPQTRVSAVLAWPYWPERGIGPGIFRPAGALFPFDASRTAITLSWQAGVDAMLYWEMAKAAPARSAVTRLPEHFNWPRFRELFKDSSINADVRADPWLADWQSIAEKIMQSGFDKRRLVPEARNDRPLPLGPGPWIGTSPFANPLLFKETPVFPVRKKADTWISAEGLLRCNTETWILLEWKSNTSP
jgi:hypothetical protein